jgi:hypothetical protein
LPLSDELKREMATSHASNRQDDKALLSSVLDEWKRTHRLETEYKQLQNRLSTVKSDAEVLVPMYKRWNGTQFVAERPSLREDTPQRVCMCAGAAAVICARILGVLPTDTSGVDTSHIFLSHSEAQAHIQQAATHRDRAACAHMALVDWDDLTARIVSFAVDKPSALQRLNEELSAINQALLR